MNGSPISEMRGLRLASPIPGMTPRSESAIWCEVVGDQVDDRSSSLGAAPLRPNRSFKRSTNETPKTSRLGLSLTPRTLMFDNMDGPENQMVPALDGAAEVQPLDGALDGAAEVQPLDGALDGAAEVQPLDGALDGAAEVQPLDGALDGAAEVQPLDGVDLNIGRNPLRFNRGFLPAGPLNRPREKKMKPSRELFEWLNGIKYLGQKNQTAEEQH